MLTRTAHIAPKIPYFLLPILVMTSDIIGQQKSGSSRVWVIIFGFYRVWVKTLRFSAPAFYLPQLSQVSQLSQIYFFNWESWGRQKAKWLFTYPKSPNQFFSIFILGVGKKPSGFLPTPSLPNSLFSIGRVGGGKKPSGFLPTPILPNSLFSIGRVGVGKKPSGFLPTPTLPTSSFQFSYLRQAKSQDCCWELSK